VEILERTFLMSWWKRRSKSEEQTEPDLSESGEEAAEGESTDPATADESMETSGDAEGIPDTSEAVDEAPRPPGTPSQAAPTEGATSWVIRRVTVAGPNEAYPGDNVHIALTLAVSDASEIDAVPDDATAWTGEPVQVEYEGNIDGAATALGTAVSGAFELAGEGEVQIALPLMVACSLTGVTVQIRCFTAGYEVGRVRVDVPGRGEEQDEGVALGGGVLAIPDTILS